MGTIKDSEMGDQSKAERQPFIHSTIKSEVDRDFLNSRSKVLNGDEKTVYVFNYKDEHGGGREVITWMTLKHLRDKRQWQTLRHPMLLNFLNEKLIDCAPIYLLHIILYLKFLLLLSSYIFYRSLLQDAIGTLFLIVVKGAIKIRHSQISCWFVVSYLFNIVTYAATFLFIWTPIIFNFDDYHPELKTITWFLPIIAVLSAWINFLYILRKSPSGIYILMLSKIFRSFTQIAIIWIPTLIAFSFAFQLIMRNSGTEPWDPPATVMANSTIERQLLTILQAITKTSSMMIGEVDVNTLLERQQWIPNVLLIAFEITTVILLMNLMVSLAVGDVNDLKMSAQDRLLEIKVNFCIEMLQLSGTCTCLAPYVSLLHTRPTRNYLVIEENESSYSLTKEFEHFKLAADVSDTTTPRSGGVIYDLKPDTSGFLSAFKMYHLRVKPSPNEQPMRLEKHGADGRNVYMSLDGCVLQLIESARSGIPPMDASEPLPSLSNTDSVCRRLSRWLIGVDWDILHRR